MHIILASGSARRRELMHLLTDDFEVITSDCDESYGAGLSPNRVVEMLSQRKGQAVLDKTAHSTAEPLLLISADTVVALGNRIIGKPKDRNDAIEILSSLSGNVHQVYTGVSVFYSDGTASDTRTFSQRSDVEFYNLTRREIEDYVDREKPYDKAGAYGIQEGAALFVSRIDGDFYNIVGLPAARLNRCIKYEMGLADAFSAG